MKLRTLLFALTLLVVPSLTLAVPTQIPYSGQLSEGGVPVNGTRAMTFVFYDAAVGGSALYTQNETAVTVTNGIYHVELNAPSTVWTGADRWLGVSVGAGSELTPRTKIGTVPYAVRAGSATIADGLSSPPPQPGVNWTHQVLQLNIRLQTDWTLLEQVTLDAPSSGYVVVLFNTTMYYESGSFAAFQINPVLDPNEFTATVSWSSGGLGSIPVGFSKVFTVSSGVTTFKVFGKAPSGDVEIFRTTNMTAMFFPNRYQ